MRKTFSLWILLILVLTAMPVYAQRTLALQEKCAEGAKQFFFKRINSYGGKWGLYRDEAGFGSNKFESHYNKKLGKMFSRESNMAVFGVSNIGILIGLSLAAK